MSTSVHPGARVDPRVERSRLVIRRAALEELGELGFGSFTIESVATRAGVGKSTIYRHWPNKLALIADAFQTLNVQAGPNLDESPPRERVEKLVRHVAEIVVEPPFSACIPALIDAAERNPEVREFHHRFSEERRRTLVHALEEGVAAGEFPADMDPELAALALVGPVFYRRLMTGQPFEPDQIPALIDTVLGKQETWAQP